MTITTFEEHGFIIGTRNRASGLIQLDWSDEVHDTLDEARVDQAHAIEAGERAVILRLQVAKGEDGDDA